MMHRIGLAGATLLVGLARPVLAQDVPAFQYLEVFSDSQGISHIRDERLAWQGRVGTSNLPTLTTSAISTTKISFVRIPKGQQQDWHPAPAKQFVIVLSGIAEVEVEDGQRRTAGPGSVALVSDIQGRGHRTNVLGDQDLVLAFIPVP